MNDSDLSFIDVGIDLNKVEPLERKKVISYVNYCLVEWMKLLNDFVCRVEKRFIELERQMSRAEMDLRLLEAKLDSIPGLLEAVENRPKDSVQETPQIVATKSSESLCNSSAAKTEVIAHESASALNSTTGLDSAPENVEKTDISDEQNGSSETTLRVRDDPRYSKYFKMLKMGVIEGAVRQKMVAEGVDPALLDTPDAPSVLPADYSEEKNDSSSDDEHDSESASDI